MRYEDWDILLFPDDRRVPVREFKVACHVVHDSEFSHLHGSNGIPTVCCFVPSLLAGEPFQVSIHSWANQPVVSQFTRSYTDFVDAVKFEARLFIDGRLVSSTCIGRATNWPHLISHSFEINKMGDLEPLKFPLFRQELLQQSHWSPADDIGRIKIVISEGFPRDSLSMPIERVKNVVAFSFQHAPLDVLESAGIAWPNPQMWRQQPYTASMPASSSVADRSESHAHSPRRNAEVTVPSTAPNVPTSATFFPMKSMNCGLNNLQQFPNSLDNAGLTLTPTGDQISNMGPDFSWMGGISSTVDKQKKLGLRMNRNTNTDTSMPDYDPRTEGTDKTLAGANTTSPNQGGSILDGDTPINNMKAPANTPTSRQTSKGGVDSLFFPLAANKSSMPADLATSLTNSLLNQPVPYQGPHHAGRLPATEVKSRKETRTQGQEEHGSSAASSSSTFDLENQDIRKVSQQMRIPAGASLPVDMVSSQGNSPQLFANKKVLDTSQRTSSMGDFTSDVPNQSTPEGALRVISGNSDKSSKRSRNFTPASSKAIDEEDQPRRASPRMRMTSFGPVEKSGAVE